MTRSPVRSAASAMRLPLSSRNLRVDGVAFVPLTGERAQVMLLTRPDARNPALRAPRESLANLQAGKR
jgi:hypothetical protein